MPELWSIFIQCGRACSGRLRICDWRHNLPAERHPSAASRSNWTPKLSNWDPFETWQKEGSETVLQRANRHYKQVLAECPESLLDGTQEKALKAYVESNS